MFAKGFESVDKRFDPVESQLDKVEGQLEKVESCLETVEGRVINLEHGQEEVKKKLDNFVYRHEFVELQRRVSKLESSDV
jgi:hypothetical protein